AAQQQGAYVAKHILKTMDNQQSADFKYFDKGSMATIGRNRAVVDMGRFHIKGFLAWLTWMFVHLVSIFGFRNKLVTFVNWSIKFFTKNSGIRLIINKYKRPDPENKNSVECQSKFSMENKAIAKIFILYSQLMELFDENPFRTKAMASASFKIDKLPFPAASATMEELSTQPGIGKSTAERILTILETGS